MGANLIINLACIFSAVLFFLPHGSYGIASALLGFVAMLSLATKGMLRTHADELANLNRLQILGLVGKRALGR